MPGTSSARCTGVLVGYVHYTGSRSIGARFLLPANRRSRRWCAAASHATDHPPVGLLAESTRLLEESTVKIGSTAGPGGSRSVDRPVRVGSVCPKSDVQWVTR